MDKAPYASRFSKVHRPRFFNMSFWGDVLTTLGIDVMGGGLLFLIFSQFINPAIVAVIVLILCVCFSVWMFGFICLPLRRSFHSGDVRWYREEKALREQKHPLPMRGHPEFINNVNRVLDELQQRAPHRYKEAITYLPRAEYRDRVYYSPDKRQELLETKEAQARSDGLFAIDGSGNGRANDYQRFRLVFLHEVGHCVNIHQRKDSSEAAADNYADTVQRELGE